MAVTVEIDPKHQNLRISCEGCGHSRDLSFSFTGELVKTSQLTIDIFNTTEVPPEDDPRDFVDVAHVVL